MKIYILYHIKEREFMISEIIKEAILKRNGNAEVRISNFDDVRSEIWEFLPDIILTIPPRNYWASDWLMMVKAALRCSIVSLLTEGFFFHTEKKDWEAYVGTNNYSAKLVDYFLFWGSKTKEGYVDVLLENGKIIEKERAKVVGYVYYEQKVFREYAEKISIPQIAQKWVKNYNKRILCLTGFMVADYSVENYKCEMATINKENRGDEYDLEKIAQNKIKAFYKYREKYINNIIQCASLNPDIGFLVKLHPAEFAEYFGGTNYQFYHVLDKYPNIYLLNESIPLGRLLPHASLLVHYGSTSGLEAYLYKVPTLHVFYEKYIDDSHMPGYCIYKSNQEVNIEDFEQLNKYVVQGVPFEKLEIAEKILYEQFDWKDNPDDYYPSEKIAKYVLNSQDVKQILDNDILLKRAARTETGCKCRIDIWKKIFLLHKQKRYAERNIYVKILKRSLPSFWLALYDIIVYVKWSNIFRKNK